MRVKRFEEWMRDLVADANHPEVEKVETFAEGGYTDKPCGLHVKFYSGAEAFVQFVRTAPPGGDNHTQPEKVVRRPDYDVREEDKL